MSTPDNVTATVTFKQHEDAHEPTFSDACAAGRELSTGTQLIHSSSRVIHRPDRVIHSPVNVNPPTPITGLAPAHPRGPAVAPWWGRFNNFHRHSTALPLRLYGRCPRAYLCYVELAGKLVATLEQRGNDWYTLVSLEGGLSRTMRAPDVDGVLMRVSLGRVPLTCALAEA